MINRPPHRYTLILVHTPLSEDIADFLTIRNMMLGYAPDIQTFVVSVEEAIAEDVVRASRERPTLIFSPMPVSIPGTMGGTRLIVPADSTKYHEAMLLADAGLPVPNTWLVTPELRLDDVGFGPLCIVKPNRRMQGKDVKLLNVDKLEDYLRTSRSSDILVQEWIDTGTHPSSYRVMTVLGKAIYSVKSTAIPALSASSGNVPPEGLPASLNGQERELRCAFDQDVLKLAEKVHETLDHSPVMGIDIVREESSGKLFVLEINPSGWAWHLSSRYFKQYRAKFSLDLYNQFGALMILREVLARKTRQLAT